MTALHLALGFMAAAGAVSVAAKRLRVPYTVALVVAGLAAGALRLIPSIRITPDEILVVLIVPLLFEGAIRLPRRHLRAYAPLILALAVGGTLIAAGIIASAAAVFGGLPWRSAAVLGAIAAAIDPAGVIALVRDLRLDERLGTVLEGEAVVNDAVAIVLFGLVGTAAPPLGAAVPAFLWLLAGGTAVGALAGAAGAYVLGPVSEPVTEALGSLVAAGAAYAAAQAIGTSGVIAVVAAGVAFAGLAMTHVTPAGRETVGVVWDVIAFLANSALFLLVGLIVPLALLAHRAGLVAIVAAAAFIARALAVYLLSAAFARRGAPVPVPWRHVLVWGGLRGGVAVALVLALPAELPQHDAVAAGILGLVVWTLVGQGLLAGRVLRWSGLRPASRRVPESPGNA